MCVCVCVHQVFVHHIRCNPNDIPRGLGAVLIVVSNFGSLGKLNT